MITSLGDKVSLLAALAFIYREKVTHGLQPRGKLLTSA